MPLFVENGSVRLYNYSNGVLLNDLTNDSTGSILTVLATQEDFANKTLKPQDAKEQYLIASGWNCVVWIWPAVINKRGDVGYIQKLIPKGNIDSLEEIISMHFRNPNILFTGSKDGHFLPTFNFYNELTSPPSQHNIEAVEDITRFGTKLHLLCLVTHACFSSCKLVATWRAHSGGGVRRVRAIKRKEMHLLVSCGGEERGRAILWRIDGSKIGEIRSDYNSLPLWKQADLLA
eukprot:765820-Hanusia_phi.AAC.1